MIGQNKTAVATVPDDYWGLCPECHEPGVRVDYFRDSWFVCEKHKLRWCADYGFTPQIEVMREMEGDAAAEKMHADNVALLTACTKVEAFHWPPTLRQRLSGWCWALREKFTRQIYKTGLLKEKDDLPF